MADVKTQWHEAHRELLALTNIEDFYASAGVRFDRNGTPNISGWLKCHAYGREDSNPSAAINVGGDGLRGRYKDFGGDAVSQSIFEFAAKNVGGYGPTWRDARRKFAADLKFELPKSADSVATDKVTLFPASPGMLVGYAAKKPPIKAAAILKCGGTGAHYPANAPHDRQQALIVFPSFGEKLLDGDVHSYQGVNSTGESVLKYQGKGKDSEPLKTITLVTPGLPPGMMNVHALKHLQNARVVWICEGLPDMLTMQTMIPEWLDTDHVVITTGSCSYHPRPEWIQHFAGKQVYICMDADEPGQAAAKVWVQAVINVAAAVKNIQLPYPIEPKHGKDIRDYFGEEIEGERRTFKDLLALADATEAIAIDDESQKLSKHEAILQCLKVIATGQFEDTGDLEIYSEALCKKSRIKDPQHYTYVHAVRDMGNELVDRFILKRGEEAGNGKFHIDDVRTALADLCGREFLDREPAIGAGVWHVKEDTVLVGHKSCDVWDGKTLERFSAPAVHGRRVDFAAEPWYDHAHLASLLQLAASPGWCETVAEEATQLFGRWDNWRHPSNPSLIAGLVMATWVQTLWGWRPQVGVTGTSGSGKSMLLEDCLQVMFGKLACFNSKSTEAGIRHAIRNTAKVILTDEFEDDKHRVGILNMLRTAGRGGKSLRGTSNQRGISFGLQHIAWVGAIELGLHAAADRNRFIMLDLENLPPGSPSKLTLPPKAELTALGQKLLAVAIRNAPKAIEMADKIRQVPLATDRRIVESFSAPASLIGCAYGMTLEETTGNLRLWLGERDLSAQEESDEERLMRTIYETTIIMPGGKKVTISDVISGAAMPTNTGDVGARDQILRSNGIRIMDHLDPPAMFFSHGSIRRELLSRTPYAEQDISQILLRIKGAKRTVTALSHAARGITIPQASIDALIGETKSPIVHTEIDSY